MSRIVFFCIPAHGHTNPTLGVVRELADRGHEVYYYSYELMREKIESAGAVFCPCDAFDAEQRLSPEDGARIGKDLAFSTKILVDTTLALDEGILHEMQQLRPDCIVADSMAVWGRLIAQKLHIPLVSSTTTFAFNRHSSRVMKQGLGDLIKMLFAMPKISREIRRLQAKGYPVKSILDIIGNDDKTHTVVYTSPEFQPCAETFSDRFAFVGPSIRPVAEPFRKERETLIYISMGTVNNRLLSFYRSCIEALGSTKYQVVLSVGTLTDPKELGALPENISAFSSVDQIAVLQQADLFLTHCGMNSTSEGLYFGVPLLMYPQTAEQSGVAARTEELGAGLRLPSEDPAAIRKAVERALSDPTLRENAARIGASFRACGGAKAAAEKILQVAGAE